MKNFDKIFNREKGKDSRKRDPRRGNSGKGQFGNKDRERPQMHEVICSDCGRKCEVPFRPTGEKPVYCSQCFSNHRGSSASGRPERRGNQRPRFQDKRMFDAICNKCGKRFELPFRPTGEKPVYCSQCFDKGGNYPNKNNDRSVDQNKEQFDMLNAKLDMIIKALTSVAPAKKEKKGVIVKKKKVVAGKKKTKKV